MAKALSGRLRRLNSSDTSPLPLLQFSSLPHYLWGHSLSSCF